MSKFVTTGLALALLLSGCGGGGEGAAKREKTLPVSGKVTYRGQPVTGATVTFSPGQDPNRKAGFAVTDDNGNYTIGTYVVGDGAIEGTYFVTVSKAMPTTVRQPDPPEDQYVPPEDMPPVKTGPPVQMIPAKYATSTSSGLTFEVKVGNDKFDIELKD